jgi:hypothetical protein
MFASTDSNIIAKALDWIKARAVRDNELASLSSADLQLLATDIGVTEADLRDVVPRIGDHSELMDKMLRARGLDPVAARHAFGGAMRDMEVTCARCRDSGVCRRRLAAGAATEGYYDFCANAGAIGDLLESRV